MIPNLIDAIADYENAVVEVGCARHADPTCLCDVTVTDPVPIRYPLGNDRSAVLFSQTVDQDFPAAVDVASHLTALAALYELAAPRLPMARAVSAEAENETYEFRSERKWPKQLSAEDEYWLRKDIPATWAAAATDLHASTIRRWRRDNGVVITAHERCGDWTFSDNAPSRHAGRLAVQAKHNSFLADPETQAILRDESLTATEAAVKLGRSVSYVRDHRAKLGVKSEKAANVGRDKRYRVFTEEELAVLNDPSIGTMEGARRLNMVPSNFKRYRTKLRAGG